MADIAALFRKWTRRSAPQHARSKGVTGIADSQSARRHDRVGNHPDGEGNAFQVNGESAPDDVKHESNGQDHPDGEGNAFQVNGHDAPHGGDTAAVD